MGAFEGTLFELLHWYNVLALRGEHPEFNGVRPVVVPDEFGWEQAGLATNSIFPLFEKKSQ